MNQISQQELHHLITISTGFIDAYMIQCYNKPSMLIPQNIVLSAIDSSTHVDYVEWHETKLPVYALHSPEKTLGVALVIEGDEDQERFVLMCDEMPQSLRLRISEVIDDNQEIKDPLIFQYVKVGEDIFHIPHMKNIQAEMKL